MQLHSVAVRKSADAVRLVAEVESERRDGRFELYFEFPIEYEAFVPESADPFAVAMLVPAMFQDEPLKITPPLSPRLMFNLPQLRDIFHAWHPGKLRAIAMTSAKRSVAAPELPTVAEAAGLPGYEASLWYGIMLPAGTPREIVQLLNAEIVKALANPEIKDLLGKQAMSPVGSTQAEFAAFLKKDIATWKDVAALAKVSVE